ncbi:hypothetical protein EVA_13842 [gut metagenome]|uniref:Uncharacterized protein n=1 Tax=gut metagenome TaxID=749906 RepID=J9FSZ7_9ZZZZ
MSCGKNETKNFLFQGVSVNLPRRKRKPALWALPRDFSAVACAKVTAIGENTKADPTFDGQEASRRNSHSQRISPFPVHSAVAQALSVKHTPQPIK